MNAKSMRERKISGISARVLKVMSLFSGVQSLQIVCSIVKFKLVSMWLHASGIGLFGIFNTTVEMVASLTDSGLRTTAVREISVASNHPSLLKGIARTVRAWSTVIGIGGAVIMCGASPWLSLGIFGNMGYWWMFAVLSLAVLFNSVLSGEKAILQGMGNFKALASTSMWSSAIGLAVSVPMFWYWGDEGIVPSFLAFPIVGLLSVVPYMKRAGKFRRPTRSVLVSGKKMVTLGGWMAFALFSTNLAQTIFLAWLNREGSLSEVGYYNAAATVSVRYIGIVIAAIGMEFYPRLSANINNKRRVELFVSHEISLVLAVLTPLLLLFLLLRNIIVEVLYTSDFLVIVPFLVIAAVHSVFRAVSTCIAFTIVARGNGPLYLITEASDAVIGTLLCMVGFKFWGLTGIGAAFVIWFLLYLAMVWVVFGAKFGYRLSAKSIRSIIASASAVGLGSLSCFILPEPLVTPVLLFGVIICIIPLRKVIRRKSVAH